MSLRLVTAARTESLVAQYVRDREALVIGPFEREAIVVARTNGMRTWVENTLAERLGCAASLQIASPRGFVAQLAQAMGVLPRGPAGQAFERPALAWRIAALLDRGGLSGDLYAPLHAYLQAQHETRLDGAVSLASRLATVYDDYQIYRPEVLEAWSQQEPAVPSFPHEPWQAHLWRRLRHASSEETGREIDRAEMARDLLARLGAPPPGGGRPAGLPPAVSVFGASLFPPVYFRVLRAAAAHVPVTLYVTVPGADRLGGLPHDWEPTHPLLRDLGAATRETGRVWHRLGLVPEIHLPAPDPAPTALGALQHALLTDTAPAVTEAADDTLCVTDAHSVVRELEVLRDHLLDAFEHVDGLTPDEVGILVPDLATYAPLVDAVFGNAGVGMRLPYHIADHPQAPEVRVLGAFERLLALGDGRASASDVLGLLDVPAVRRAAEIRESELSLVHEWTREACVHWGRDAQHKAAVGLPEDDLHTWQFGLDRL
ncbi:MAG: exodeoxyribonuclease V subunit gamma, partial [Bacteroidota bacterium]